MKGFKAGMALFTVLVILPLFHSPLFGQEQPSYLPSSLSSTFKDYTQQPTPRAFALGRNGAWGTAYGRGSLEEAREAALSNCRAYADRCVVIAENDELVHSTSLFPASSDPNRLVEYVEAFSPQTTYLLALIALVLLVAGTVISEKYPLYLFDTVLSDVLKIRMNYTIYPFGILYFFCLFPWFSRILERDHSNPLTWIYFSFPILLYGSSVLYLYGRGKLAERFELD